MSTNIKQYRLDSINEANKEISMSDDQRKSHHKLFCVANYARLRSIIGDMLASPVYTTDYADALTAFVDAYTKLRSSEDK